MCHWISGLADFHGVNTLDALLLITLVAEEVRTVETDQDIANFLEWNDRIVESKVMPSAGYLGRPLTKKRLELAGQKIAGDYRPLFNG